MRAASPKSARLAAELLERGQPRLDGRPAPARACAPRARAPRVRRARWPAPTSRPRARSLIASSAACARAQRLAARLRARASTLSDLAAQIVLLDVELAERLAHAIALRGGVLDGMAQRRDRVERRVDARRRAASTSRLESLDLLLRRGVALRWRPPGRPRPRRAPARPRLRACARDSMAIRAGSRRASRSRISAAISRSARRRASRPAGD